MCRITSRLTVALGTIVFCLASRANAGADPQLSVGVFLGVRQTTASAEASCVAPYNIQVPYQVYSSALVVSALPSSRTEDDVAEMKKAFGLQDAKLIHETKLNCEAPAADSGTSVVGSVIPSSYTVDAVIPLSAAQATVLGFMDSEGTPRFVVFRRGA
jgi:hypothetical protein